MKKIFCIVIILIFVIHFSKSSSISSICPASDMPGFQTGTVTDIEGNVYKTIKIGDQWWMAENLKVTINEDKKSVKCYNPDNKEENSADYGKLYTWDAAMNGSNEEGARGIAPEGWHIPSIDEWKTLFEHLGGIKTAAKKMKAVEKKYWQNNVSDNSSGFTALPAGGYIVGEAYEGFGGWAHFWSSSGGGKEVFMPTLSSESDEVFMLNFPLSGRSTASIRCIKN